MTTPTPRDAAQDLPALLPCPFCGGKPLLYDLLDTHGGFSVECPTDGCDTEKMKRTKVEAVSAWNRRAALAAQPAPEAQPVPAVWVRRNGGFSSGVAHFGPECPPGWALAAEPFYASPVAQTAADLEREREARKTAQAENGALKERLARARLDLMRELRDQGWMPPAAHAQQPAALTDAQIVAAARALNKRHAELCNVNEVDSWNLQADDFKDDARAALEAAHGIPAATQAPTTDTEGRR